MADFKIEHNVETNEIIEIPLTAKEIKDNEKLTAQALAIEAEEKAKAADKAADKASILSHLGLTEEQAKLLLG